MATKQRFTAKHLRDLLIAKDITNDEKLVGDTGGKVPYVAFRNGFKRKDVASAWQVLVPGRRTDPDGNFRDGFNKTFLVSESGTITTPEMARQWASETYGIHDWVKTPFGSWTSKAHLDVRLRELLPEHFDPDYRDPIRKLQTNDSTERFFRVVVQLYAKPEPPFYVNASNAEEAHRQVTQLFVKLAGTRVLDGLKLNVYDA